MGTVKGKIGITLYLGDKTLEEIDKKAKKVGLSRSQYVEYELRKLFVQSRRKQTLKENKS